MPELLELMDISIIPREYGGECDNVPWDLNNSDATGCSKAQIKAYMQRKYTPDNISNLLTPEEIESLQLSIKIEEQFKNGTSFPWNRGPIGISESSSVLLRDNQFSQSESQPPSEGLDSSPHMLSTATSSDTSGVIPFTESPVQSLFIPIRARMIKAEVSK